MQSDLVFYKPFGVLCQFSGEERPTLRDFIPVKGVYPAGRLDHDSEGLLLLTSDGGLQHRLTDPDFEHPKTYWAQVEGIPEEIRLDRLRRGVEIQGYPTRPAKVAVLGDVEAELPRRDPPIRFRKSIPTAWLEITLTEGRNRQVRRMTAAVGLPTLRLVRVRIGDISLSGLRPGEWRWLTPEESRALRAKLKAVSRLGPRKSHQNSGRKSPRRS